MSAFIVSTDHIDYIVSAAISEGTAGGSGIYWDASGTGHRGMYERVELGNADAFGAMLLRENIASVSYRYGEGRDNLPGPVPTPAPDDYEYTPYGPVTRPGGVPDVVQVLKALDCYEYQACEHPGWKDSEARRICDVLRSRMISQLPGYDAALWEVDRTKLAGDAIIARRRARDTDTPAVWALHTLTDGGGVVVHRNRAGKVIGGHAGFNATDVDHAISIASEGRMTNLRDWQFLTITQEAAAYVAATFPLAYAE